MFKKLAGFLFVFMVAFSTSAYALTCEQIKTKIEKYVNITIADKIFDDCLEYNIQPPKSISVFVSSYSRNDCITFLHFVGGADPRIVTKIANMAAVEIAIIVRDSGVSEKQMQANDFHVLVVPATKNSKDQWKAYDATVLGWKGNTPKLEKIDADFVQRNIIDR